MEHRVINRRNMLKRITLSTLSIYALGNGIPAFAQQKRLVIGTWGGDYANLLTKFIEDPFLKTQGYTVLQDQASDAPRRSKLMAEKRLPRGSSDVQALAADNMFEMNENGALETLDYSKIPNAANLIPQMKYPYGIGQIYSGKVIVFNKNKIKQKITTFKEVLSGSFGAKLGFIDIQYRYIIISASLAATNGKSDIDFDAGKKLLLEAKKAGARIYPTNEAFAQALSSEEIDIGLMWKARVLQWQKSGIPCDSVAATEGIPLYISGFAIPKNAQNKEGAYEYLNAALNKQAQKSFALEMGYNPTVTGIDIPPDIQQRIGFSEEEKKRLLDLNYSVLAKNDAALKEWWDKVFKNA